MKRNFDAEVREAYRKACGKDAGNITAGPCVGGYRVSVLDPQGKEIPGFGDTRDAAYENLLELLESVVPKEEAEDAPVRGRRRGGTPEEKAERDKRAKELTDTILDAMDDVPADPPKEG